MSYAPIINVLLNILQPIGGKDALEAAVLAAKAQLPELMTDMKINSADDFLTWAQNLLSWIPYESSDATMVYNTVCLFHFIFNQPPLGAAQTDINPANEGKPLTPLSAWIVCFAVSVGLFLDSTESYSIAQFNSFNVATIIVPEVGEVSAYRLFECESPDGTGFSTFNQFFGRKLKSPRTIAGQGDNKTVVYPADSAFDAAFPIDGTSHTIASKGLRWDIASLLQGSRYTGQFANGVWMHSFLNVYNYHRQHAPVSGTIVEAYVTQAAAYMDVTAANGKLSVAQDASGFQFLQSRGVIVIDTSNSPDGDIGLVAGTFCALAELSFTPLSAATNLSSTVLPMGMAQVSSIKFSKAWVNGDIVQKGDEISYFQFGGSDVIVVFQEKAGIDINNFNRSPSPNVPYTFYGSTLVVANP